MARRSTGIEAVKGTLTNVPDGDRLIVLLGRACIGMRSITGCGFATSPREHQTNGKASELLTPGLFLFPNPPLCIFR
jgi:hypothetical protein